MASSGTATYDLDIIDIFEEAYERAGRSMRTGYDVKTAQRSYNLLVMEWANRGINLWTLESGSLPLVAGTATYNLPADTVDILDFVIRTGSGTTQSDVSVARVPIGVYANVPNKTVTGRPIQIYVERKATPTVTFYPVPNLTSTYTFVYWRLRRMHDVGDAQNTADVPFRFIPALIAGMAYYLAMKIPEGAERMSGLKAMYDEQWALASDEDRDRSSVRFYPA